MCATSVLTGIQVRIWPHFTQGYGETNTMAAGSGPVTEFCHLWKLSTSTYTRTLDNKFHDIYPAAVQGRS